jgi:general secretion pathway protein G
MSESKPNAGFTLVELMLVVVIIGILAAVVVPRVVGSKIIGQTNAARGQVKLFETAIDLYHLETNELPGDLKDLVIDPGQDNWNGPYLKTRRIPKDPWGNPYVYKAEAARGVDYDVYSPGPDETDGTEDDIGNWPPEEGSEPAS